MDAGRDPAFQPPGHGAARRGADAPLQASIGEFLDQHRFGAGFREHYLLPMIGCIWSCPTEQMLRFPVGTLIRFCHNHGLIQVTDRPQWYTVRGGSRQYVRRMVGRLADARLATPVLGVQRRPDGVRVRTAQGTEAFDALVMATTPTRRWLLATTPARRACGAGRHPLPAERGGAAHRCRRAAPAPGRLGRLNYERAADTPREQAQVCLHYLINHLQPMAALATAGDRPLNPARPDRRAPGASPPALQPPGVRPGGTAGPAARARIAGTPPHLVLRRLVRLRLPAKTACAPALAAADGVAAAMQDREAASATGRQ